MRMEWLYVKCVWMPRNYAWNGRDASGMGRTTVYKTKLPAGNVSNVSKRKICAGWPTDALYRFF